MWNKIKAWGKKLKEKVTYNFKILGKWGTIICVFIAILLTISPSIVYVILYITTQNASFLIKAGAWVTFIIAPAGGTGTMLYVISLMITTTLGIKLRRKLNVNRHGHKEIKTKRGRFTYFRWQDIETNRIR